MLIFSIWPPFWPKDAIKFIQPVWMQGTNVVFLQGLRGPPGPEGLLGPRGEPVSHFQSLAWLSDAEKRQHGVTLTDRDIKWHSSCFSHCPSSSVFFPLYLFFFFLFFFLLVSQGKPGEPGPSGKSGLPGTPVSFLFLFCKIFAFSFTVFFTFDVRSTYP